MSLDFGKDSQLGPTSVKSGREWGNVARNGSMPVACLPQTGSNSSQTQPTPDFWLIPDETWPITLDFAPKLAGSGLNSTASGPSSAAGLARFGQQAPEESRGVGPRKGAGARARDRCEAPRWRRRCTSGRSRPMPGATGTTRADELLRPCCFDVSDRAARKRPWRLSCALPKPPAAS